MIKLFIFLCLLLTACSSLNTTSIGIVIDNLSCDYIKNRKFTKAFLRQLEKDKTIDKKQIKQKYINKIKFCFHE